MRKLHDTDTPRSISFGYNTRGNLRSGIFQTQAPRGGRHHRGRGRLPAFVFAVRGGAEGLCGFEA